MSDSSLEAGYRRFLFYLTALVLVTANLELWFSEHTESFVQLIPFGLAAIGLVATLAVVMRTNAFRLQAMRVSMGLLAVGSAYGVYEHFSHNVAFEMEIRPTITFWQAVGDALFGASPLLAPGILGFAALLGAAATYRHPAVRDT